MTLDGTKAIFTICARNYLPFARTLAQSARRHHPDVHLVLFVVDEWRDTDGAPDFTSVIPCAALGIRDFAHMAFRYTVMELSTAVKPACFTRLFADGFRQVAYFDPDIELHGPISEVFDSLDAGATTVLTPHGLEPNESEMPPNDVTFLRNGAYNLGFMALRNCEPTARLLEWWGRRLERLCVANNLDGGFFVDQKWVDLWPSYCPDVAVLRHPGYNVAYWNLDTRTIDGAPGAWTVNGAPLIFFHFSGVVQGKRRVLSKHQARWTPAASGPLSALSSAYHDALDRNTGKAPAPAYAYGQFRDGTAIPTVARWLFRDTLEPFDGDPFERVPALLIEPADISPNPNGVVTRLSHHLWKVRADLREAFTLTTADSQVQYSRWFAELGWRQADVAAEFVAPVRSRLEQLETMRRAGPKPSMWRAAGSKMARAGARRFGHLVFSTASHLRPLYRFIKPEHRRRLAFLLFVRFGWPEEPAGGDASDPQIDPAATSMPLTPGVALIGYPLAEIGVGEALRGLAKSANAAGIPIDVVNFDVHVRCRQQDLSIQHLVTNKLAKTVNLMCVNADMAGETARLLGPAALRSRYNIVRPFWELSIMPAGWIENLRAFDEIWAPTAFVQQAFAEVVKRPVVRMPMPVSLDEPGEIDRRRVDLPDHRFLFLFMFDMASYPARKNPEAVIEAFQLAFGRRPGDEVGLVIKTMGMGPDAYAAISRLRDRARRDPRISILDRTMDRRDVTSLMAASDAFVSLHRSEGFGLCMAEAMYLGKPVIGTDYSGNRDFLNAETGFPVGYSLTAVRHGDYPYYVEGQQWADPDIGDAARQMRTVFEDREKARAVARAGQAFIHTFHSPAAVGAAMRARLGELGVLTQRPD